MNPAQFLILVPRLVLIMMFEAVNLGGFTQVGLNYTNFKI
jgi:hypothetical protein